MRCYLMIKGHIAAVEFLGGGPDEHLIEQAQAHFTRRQEEGFDGFEVWDRARRVYGWPRSPPSRSQANVFLPGTLEPSSAENKYATVPV